MNSAPGQYSSLVKTVIAFLWVNAVRLPVDAAEA